MTKQQRIGLSPSRRGASWRVVVLNLVAAAWALAPIVPARAETNWLKVGEPELPPYLLQPGLAYDEGRQRVVLFGGRDRWTGVRNTQVWESDGARWVRRGFAGMPAVETDSCAMAYDAARDRIVGASGQTWEFDGDVWTSPLAAVGEASSMVYDSVRGRVLAVSGNQVQEYDGVGWTTRSPRTSGYPPTIRAAAFDAARDRLVAFSTGPQTWEWDGTDWHRLQPSNSPPESWSGMAHDPVRGRTVLVTRDGETWEWDGSDWGRRMSHPSLAIGEDFERRMVYDPKRQRTLLFAPRKFPTDLADVWEWDGTAWSARTALNTPEPRVWPLLAYDPLRQRLVLVAGSEPPGLDETWEWDGTDWSRQTPTSSPGVVAAGAAAYSPTSSAVLVVGGLVNGRGLEGTWAWDGTAWTEKRPPSVWWFYRHAAAFDIDRHVLVRYGGDTDTGTGGEWDGHAWTDNAVSTYPPNRQHPGLAYDRERHRTVLFGGDGKDDTWDWTGTEWIRWTPYASPAIRKYHTMAYDEQRRRVLVFGGRSSSTLLNDTWIWEPTAASPTWKYLIAAASPPRLEGHAMAYDSTGQRMLVFGGQSDQYGPCYNDLWELPSGLAARAGPDRILVRDVPTKLSGAGSGSETSTLAYSWTVTGGNSAKVALAGAASAAPTVTVTAPGTYVLTLSASESASTTTDAISVTVHTSPVATIPGTDRSLLYGTSPALTVWASDADGDPLSYRWSVAKGPGGGTFAQQTQAEAIFQPAAPGTYLLRCAVLDDRGGHAAPGTRLFVSSSVQANAGSNVVVPLGRRVTLDGTAASDAQGEPLAYEWALTGAPAGSSASLASISAASVQLTPDRAGDYSVRLTATAGNGLTGASSVTVSGNTTPACVAGSDRVVNLGLPAALSGTAFDPDGDSITPLWTCTAGPVGSTLTGAGTLTPTFTPSAPGVHTLRLRVTDSHGESATSELRITGNSVPVAAASAVSRVNLGTAVVLDGQASFDADGDSLSFAWTQTGGPSVTLTGLELDRAVFTPLAAGAHTFRLTVGDGRGGLSTATVHVTANTPPSVSLAATTLVTNVGMPVRIDGIAIDADADPLTIAWSVVSGPSSGLLTGAATITPTFTPTAAGWYVLRLNVDDGRGGLVSPEVRVYGNSPPTADAGHSVTTNLGSLVTLDGSASADPDGDPVGYLWSQCPASPLTVTLVNPASARAAFLLTAPQSHCFVLTASDGRGGIATDTVTVTGNTVPAVSAGAGRTERVLSSVTLTGTATDADGDLLAYTWSQTGGIGVSLLETHRLTARFSPPVAGPYTFQLAAQDGRGGAASSSVSILADTPPSVSAGPDRVVLLGNSVRLVATASDAEGDSVSFSWARDGGWGPPVALTGADTAYPSFLAGAPGTYRFVVTATDSPGLSSQASVTVTAHSSPTANAGPDQTAALGSPVLLVGSGTDPDGNTVTYLWTRTGGTGPSVVLQGSDAAVASFLPVEEGTYEFRLEVSDKGGGRGTDQCVVLAVLPDVSLPPRTTLAYASVPGGLIATVSSSGTTFPVLAYDYLLEFEPRHLAAQDSQATLAAQRNFVLTLDRFKSFVDVKLQKSGAPSVVPGEALVETRFERLLPGVALPSDAMSLLRVGMTARSRRTILRPTADAGVRQSVVTVQAGGQRAWPGLLTGGTPQPFVTLDGRASVDPNRPPLPLTYRWEVLPGGRVPTTLSASSSPVATFLPSVAGIYRFGLNVSNGILDGPRSLVEVAVDVANQAPTAVALAREQGGPARSGPGALPLVVREGAVVELDGSSSTDPDPADRFELDYAWTQTAGPALGTLASQAVVMVADITPGVYRFELLARDRAGNLSPATEVEVVAMPRTDQSPSLSLAARAAGVSGVGQDLGTDPSVAGRESLRVLVDTLVTLTASAEDVEVLDGLQRLTFSWRQVQGPAVAFAQEQAGELASAITFAPPAAGVYDFECHALETDVALRPLGVETSRRIRVVANAPGQSVPRARATLAVAGPGKASVNGHWPGAKVTGVTTAGNVVRLDGSTSTAGNPAFRWTQVDGPAVVLSNPYSAVTSFATPDLGDGRRRTYSFQLFVEDGTLRSEEAVAVIESVPPGLDPGLASAEATLTLSSGMTLISVPLQPAGAHPYDLADLVRDTGAQSVFRVVPDAHGRGAFHFWSAVDGEPAPRVGPTDAYLVMMARGVTRRVHLSGTLWDPARFTRTLHPGLNLVGVPLGFGGPLHLEELRAATGSGFVAGPHPTSTGLAIHLPGQTAPALQPGRGYLLTSPGGSVDLRPAGP